MYRVQGPVVSQLQSAFMENWIEQAKRPLHGEHYFPALEPAGELDCQVVTSSPEAGEADMELMYLLAMYAAERSIDIATPYFLPDDVLIEAFKDARERNVTVR